MAGLLGKRSFLGDRLVGHARNSSIRRCATSGLRHDAHDEPAREHDVGVRKSKSIEPEPRAAAQAGGDCGHPPEILEEWPSGARTAGSPPTPGVAPRPCVRIRWALRMTPCRTPTRARPSRQLEVAESTAVDRRVQERARWRGLREHRQDAPESRPMLPRDQGLVVTACPVP